MSQLLIFAAGDANGDGGLWLSDGTAGGTYELTGISGASYYGGIGLIEAGYTELNGQVLFEGRSDNGLFGVPELWVTNGTASGTHQLTSVGMGNEGLYISNPIAFDGKVLFLGDDQDGTFPLYVSDGTVAGTYELTGISGASSDGIGFSYPVIFDGQVLFSGASTKDVGLWFTNGTAAGTHEITGVKGANATYGLSPTFLTVFNKEVLFNGFDASGDYGLWVTNGTASGTFELTGISGASTGKNPVGAAGLDPTNFIVINQNEVLFNGVDASGQHGLWITNGTAAGTHELTGIAGAYKGGPVGMSGRGGLDPTDFTVYNGEVLFNGYDTTSGQGLWMTNGTASGTHEITVTGAYPGGAYAGLDPDNMVVFNGEVYFDGRSGSSGDWAWWVTNGTAAGTHEITSISGADPGSAPDSPTVVTLPVTIPPSVTITSPALQSDQVTVVLSGTVDAAALTSPISIYDGSTLLATTKASNVVGEWQTQVSVSAPGVHTLTAQVKSGGSATSNVIVDLVKGGKTTLSSGGQTVLFSGSGDAVTLTGTGNTVSGSNGTVSLKGAQVSVSGGANRVDSVTGSNTVTLSGTDNNSDSVSASGATINLDNAQASISGGGNTINFGGPVGTTGDTASLSNTADKWDTVNAGLGTLYLNGAQAIDLEAGGLTVDVQGGSGNALTLSGSYTPWNSVTASSTTINIDGANATIQGGGNTIVVQGVIFDDNSIAITDTGGIADAITDSSNDISMTGAQASVIGGSDQIDFESGTNSVTLSGTNGNGDTVTGAGGKVILNSAQATVSGGGDTVSLKGSGSAVTLTGTGDTVDSVTSSNGLLNLNGAEANVAGAGNTLEMTSATASVGGAIEAFVIPKTFGHDVINGWNASSTMQFVAADFANWSALQSHMAQAGANTVITLNAADTVTLDNIAMTSLHQSQFGFK